ncbi:MAG: hypothetical protein Q9218_003956 [Villophora microphyllina]
MAYKPTYEFTIPSIYDDKALACRIYSSPELLVGETRGLPERPYERHRKSWTPRGAIVAHPYTYLGGSYDDPVVLVIVEELIKQGFTVGTFNLRYIEVAIPPRHELIIFSGAGKGKAMSGGRCSWTAKPELQDYISFVGFFIYYLAGVYPPIPEFESFNEHFPLTTILSGIPSHRPPAHIILSGYSYGALLTRHLPNVPVMLGRFSKVLKTSTEAEIRHRAVALAAVTAIDMVAQRSQRPVRETNNAGQAFNGHGPASHVLTGSESSSAALEVGSPAWERAQVKKEHMKTLQKPFKRTEKKDSWPDQQFGEEPEEEDFLKRLDVPLPKTHYMLVSLLLEPAASFVCAFCTLTSNDVTKLDEKFLYNITLVLHGQLDKFTSAKKVLHWISELQKHSNERSKLVEVPDAGHFWKEPGSMEALRSQVGKWIATTLIARHEWFEHKDGSLILHRHTWTK